MGYLEDCRRRVERVVRRLGHDDVAMEYYVAEDKRPIVKCLEDVAACDLYVGIFAWRYGWIPKKRNRNKLSITEMEYRQAVKCGKTCLIFLLDGTAPWPPDFIDDDKSRIKKLRDTLAEKHGGDRFRTAEGLSLAVAEAIHKWENHRATIPNSDISEFDPKPYYAVLRKRFQYLDLDVLTPPDKEEYLQLQLRSVFVEQSVYENTPPEFPKDVWDKFDENLEIYPDALPAGVTRESLDRMRDSYCQASTAPVLHVIKTPSHQHTVILGDPGSGKSTLARYVLLSLIDPTGDEILRNAFAGYLPLIVELRTYADLRAKFNQCDTFLGFLHYMGKTEGWHLDKETLVRYLKNEGRTLIIFDGLDEVMDSADREHITYQLAGFASDYPKARILVTSRRIGYRRRVLTDAGFVHFTLNDLEEAQIDAFMKRWYALALSERPDEASERHKRIMRSIEGSPSIRQLAGNPMLLTIMAIIGKHQELPKERWKLYDHAASVLIQHWDVNKHLKQSRIEADFIGEEDKKELLRRLAYCIQNGVGGLRGNYIQKERLQTEFEAYLRERWYTQSPDRATVIARAMIDQLRERNYILARFGVHAYGFIHRALLEFFCATAIVFKFEKTQELSFSQLREDIVAAHWEDKSWHEVLRLVVGMINEKFSGELLGSIIDLGKSQPANALPWNLVLAMYCISELRNCRAIKPIINEAFEALFWVLDYRTFTDLEYQQFITDHIVPAVASIKDVRPPSSSVLDLITRLRTLPIGKCHSRILRDIGQLIGRLGSPSDAVLDKLLTLVRNKDWKSDHLNCVASAAIATGWPQCHDFLPLLRERIVQTAFIDRGTLITILAENYPHHPETLSLLCDRATNDEDGLVRATAAEALGEHFADAPETLVILSTMVQADKDERVLRIAVELFHEYYSDTPETIGPSRESAIRYTDGTLRGLSALLAVLYHRAATDNDTLVRSVAIELLGKYFSSAAETWLFLCEAAENDLDASVRSEAVDTIATHFHTSRETAVKLRELASGALYPDVRSQALRALDLFFSGDSQTTQLVRERIACDVDASTRSIAVRLLGKHASNVDDLCELANMASDPYVRAQAVQSAVSWITDDPKAVRAICTQALNDVEDVVKEAAVMLIAKHFDAEEALNMLCDCARKASGADVRAEALEALAVYFGAEAATLTLLRERSEAEPALWLRIRAKEFADTLASPTIPYIINVPDDHVEYPGE